MTQTKYYTDGSLQISESTDEHVIAVSVQALEAGSPFVDYYIYEPFLSGEDYPALVRIWDNQEDAIYDTL